MTGDVRLVGSDLYIEVNSGGTLEKLPRLGFFRRLYVVVSSKFRPWEIKAVRAYCHNHEKWRSNE